jgi:hypothetical protein
MKKLMLGLLLTVSIGTQIQAVDLKTDAVCNDLKKAIERGREIEQVKVIFEKATVQLSSADKTDLAAQVVAYAQEQKEDMQKILDGLGKKTYDTSKIMWGSAQLAGGVLCTACVLKVLWIYVNRTSILDLLDILDYLRFSNFYWDYLAQYIKDYSMVPKGVKVLIPIELVVYTLVAPYLSYKGTNNLYQGINHKKLLVAKVVHLEKIIEYFHALNASDQGEQNEIT